MNLLKETTIKRLWWSECLEKKAEREREREAEASGDGGLQFKRANARLRGKLTTNVTSFKDSRDSLSGNSKTSRFLRGWERRWGTIPNNSTT